MDYSKRLNHHGSLKSHPNCKICPKILEALTSPQDSYRGWELGKTSAIFDESECQAHKNFFNSCLHGRDWEPHESLSLSVYKGRVSLSLTYVDERGKSLSYQAAELLLLAASNSTPAMHLGRVLDRDYIDIELIRQWMSYCDEHHGPSCSEAGRRLLIPLSWLIDTEAGCLVPAREGARYVALSYVWGQVPMLKTTRDTVLALQQPGALTTTFADRIPATIRHAMGLIPQLGEKYLWVDSLCLVQDDEQLFRLNIQHMASIFETAVLTLVVADGEDAQYELRGLHGISKPRSLPPVLLLTDQASVTTRLCGKIQRSKWATRGWTLQEQLFSRRKLVFIQDSVRWICRENSYYEDVNSPFNLDPSMLYFDGGGYIEKRSIQDLSLYFPDLSILIDLLAEYSGRDLTYEEDVIPAFSSTLNVLRRGFPRGFIYGLPVSFLDAALIWRTSLSRPRRSSSGSQADCPPSWTWAGWKGGLRRLSWFSRNYIKNPTFDWGTAHWRPFQAIPMLKWETCSSVGSDPVPIPYQNEWYDFKARYMGKKDGLPPGWHYEMEDMDALQDKLRKDEEQRKEYPDISRFQDPDCPVKSEAELLTSYFYRHDYAPDRKFWHPVPVGSDKAELSQSQIHYGRYLRAKTQKARLWAVRPLQNTTFPVALSYQQPGMFVAPMFSTILGVTTVLRNNAGVDVGELQIDWIDDSDRVMAYEPGEGEIGHPCDIVAISRGFDFPQPMEPEKETYTFYNVLWVVWVDGIAYRRGVGRVKRQAWDGLDRGDIELILG